MDRKPKNLKIVWLSITEKKNSITVMEYQEYQVIKEAESTILFHVAITKRNIFWVSQFSVHN